MFLRRKSSAPRRIYAWDLAHRTDDPVIVCVDDPPPSDERFRIPGDVTLERFKSTQESIGRDREIVFYTAAMDDQPAIARAQEYQDRGYSKASFLAGGVHAWNSILPFLRHRGRSA